MAANIRYRTTYYNTTGDPVTWKLEILDTEAVGAVVNFQSTTPNESFEGLTENLNPGIYPTSLRFGMYLRPILKTIGGIHYGVTSDFWDDIFTAAEGRFLVRYYKDDVLQFVGPIIYDQCSLADESIPLLQITAVDGLNRWNTTDYVSEVGQIVYHTVTDHINVFDTNHLAYDGLITEIITIEHTVSLVVPGTVWLAQTTFAHREQFSINSPGTGWVFQGEGRWAKELSYSNEQITEDTGVSYHFTRDIDDEKHRTVSEYIQRAMVETNMAAEYADVMWDTSSEWFENDMGDLTADPFTQMRLHEEAFISKNWNAGMLEVCRLLNMRIYYSNGRYHFEQISLRDSATFTRYIYNSDGTSAGANETASLDLDFDTLPVEPSVGGLYKVLPPLRSVTARITLDNSNLLDGVDWEANEYGERYLGRIKQVDGNQMIYIRLNVAVTSTFNPSHLLLFPGEFINVVCEHVVTVYYQVRITNINTATTYWLAQDGVADAHVEWSTTFNELNASGTRFGHSIRRYSYENYGYTVDRKFYNLAETLPGTPGDMYDVHVSVRREVEFANSQGTFFWVTLLPEYFWSTLSTSNNQLRLYSEATLDTDQEDWVESEGGAELVYVSENDVDNSIKVTTELQWADTSQHEKSIEIYDGTNWKKSSGWSIGGIGTAIPILHLLVNEIMSLRTLPKKLYSGSFLSSLPNAESRFKRGSDYYLPLSCTKNTDEDEFSGQFLQIAKYDAPDVTVINEVIMQDYTEGPHTGGGDSEESEPTLYFETNEVILAGATLTEVDILNTLGVYVASGETVKIVTIANGEYDSVTLTQEILPADTVMYFESNIMTYDHPDGSLIVIQDGDVVIEGSGTKYYYSNDLYNGSTHTIPLVALLLTGLDGLSPTRISKKVAIYRGGARMLAKETPVNPSPQFFWYDSGTNELTFHLELVDEELIIDIDLNR